MEIEYKGIKNMFILLSADGNIQRSGSGRMGEVKSDLFVGQTNEPLFNKVKEVIKDDVLQIIGKKMTLPNPVGEICTLNLFFSVDNVLQQIVVVYGQQSGLPLEILQIVRTMHEVTEPRYQKMVQTTKAPEKKKGFWPFK